MPENEIPGGSPENTPVEQNGAAAEQVPVSWREPVAVFLAVLLADAALYHGGGYSGLAAFIVGAIALLGFGAYRPRFDRVVLLFGIVGFLIGLKLVWCGNGLLTLLGFGFMLFFAALQAGRSLMGGDFFKYLEEALKSGGFGFVYLRRMRQGVRSIPQFGGHHILIVMPLLAVGIFGAIFICANPDLQDMLWNLWSRFTEFLSKYYDWIPFPSQVLLWLVVAWCMVGLMRPKKSLTVSNDGFFGTGASETTGPLPTEPKESDPILFAAYRNTLVALSLLFAVYLMFEFHKNWTRDFPQGFNYSRHMHQGAAFLTLALGVSTLVYCVIFRAGILRDARIGQLKKWGAIWGGLNFLLAFSVYNRLFIYIDLNGLSRLRIIGLLGCTAVVLGLIAVIRMVWLFRDMIWLLPRYAWSVIAVVAVGLILPWDGYIAKVNTARVMKGDLLPSVFLFGHPESAEEYLASLPLMDSEDKTIREGARAIFAKQYLSLQKKPWEGTYAWTAFQWSNHELLKILERRKGDLEPYWDDEKMREKTIETFRKYTDRWI